MNLCQTLPTSGRRILKLTPWEPSPILEANIHPGHQEIQPCMKALLSSSEDPPLVRSLSHQSNSEIDVWHKIHALLGLTIVM